MKPNDLHAVAQGLFLQKGRKLTVSDIARAAGVSRPTVYQQLGTKSDILARFAQDGTGTPQSQDVEARIMAAVLSVAARTGFAALTVDDVAAQADVAVATIFRRYGTKDDLLRTFAANHAPSAVLLGTGIEHEAGLAGLSRIAETLLTFMSEHRDLVRLVLSGSLEDRKYLRELRAHTRGSATLVAGFFHAEKEQGRLETDLSAQDLTQNLLGLCYAQAVLSDVTVDPARSLAAVVAMFHPFFKEPRG